MSTQIIQDGKIVYEENKTIGPNYVFLKAAEQGKLNLRLPFSVKTPYAMIDLPVIPVIQNIDVAILAELEHGGELDMDDYHAKYECDKRDQIYKPCGTTHCRAGWAIMLAGEPGFEIERKLNPYITGTLIYLVSRPGESPPDFYDDTDNAMADIIYCATRQRYGVSSITQELQ